MDKKTLNYKIDDKIKFKVQDREFIGIIKDIRKHIIKLDSAICTCLYMDIEDCSIKRLSFLMIDGYTDILKLDFYCYARLSERNYQRADIED